jgi:hypothetical protein
LVREVWATYHHHPDRPPSLISLHVLKDRWIELRCAPAGWGIAVQTVAPVTADLGEYGELRSSRLTKDNVLGHLEGRSITKVNHLIALELSTDPFGYVLIADDHRCALWCSCDELEMSGDWQPRMLGRWTVEEIDRLA